MVNIEEVVQKYPGLNFLKTALFRSLPKEKQNYLLGCVEDAIFWIELGKNPNQKNTDGFKFLAASLGYQQAAEDAAAKGLQGGDRKEYMKPYQELLTQMSPHAGLPGVEEN